MADDLKLWTKVVVRLTHGEPEEFTNAGVSIAAPGLFVIRDRHTEFGMYPIGSVVGIRYPEGEMKVISL
jgi:hypothetical protein